LKVKNYIITSTEVSPVNFANAIYDFVDQMVRNIRLSSPEAAGTVG
jgi:hypothetical protein